MHVVCGLLSCAVTLFYAGFRTEDKHVGTSATHSEDNVHACARLIEEYGNEYPFRQDTRACLTRYYSLYRYCLGICVEIVKNKVLS